MPLDLDALTAIDVHVHVESDGHGHNSLDDELLGASAAYFHSGQDRTPTVERLAAFYRERQMAAVIFTIDATTATGQPALSSAEIADRAAEFPDALIPFGSVDPLQPGAAVGQARRLVPSTGRGASSSTPACRASPRTTRALYPLYAAIEELGVPVVFHTGQTGIGAGLPVAGASSCGCPTRC